MEIFKIKSEFSIFVIYIKSNKYSPNSKYVSMLMKVS